MEIDENTSDGYHTFKELYDHRRALTAALIVTNKFHAWRSRNHHPEDSPCPEGFFIVGIYLPSVGSITYHYENQYWEDFYLGTDDLDHAPKWDGASPSDTVTRLLEYVRGR